MSMEYTSYVVYGFSFKLNEAKLRLLQEHFNLPFDESYFREAPEEYLTESAYELMEHFPAALSLDVYHSEDAPADDTILVVSQKEGRYCFNRYEWESVTPTHLKETPMSSDLSVMVDMLHPGSVGWLVYSTVS